MTPSPPPRPLAVAGALFALALAVHGRTVGYPFVHFDDEAFLVSNPAVAGGISWDSVRWAFATDMDAGWIPLTWLSRLLDVTLFGLSPWGHHLGNVLLHGANASLLFLAFRRLTGRHWESAFAAALLAVHPLHVESVAWVTERKDVLAGLFWWLSLLAYSSWAGAPSPRRYAALLGAFVLGLMAKPAVVVLPFVLLLLDRWPLGRLRPGALPQGAGEGEGAPRGTPLRALLLEKVPLLVLAAAVSAATLRLQGSVGALDAGRTIPLWARAANGAVSYGFYLRKAAWPSGLAVFYPHPLEAVDLGAAAASLLLLAAATAWAVRERDRRPWLLTGWLWYLGVLFPVIGLVQAGGQAAADRYAYLSLPGIYLAAACGAGEAARRRAVPPRAVAACAAAILCALSLAGFRQAGYWRDTETLMGRALAVTGDNWLAHVSLGRAALEAGRKDEALSHFREVLRSNPRLPEVSLAAGQLLLEAGRVEEAERAFRDELLVQPGSAGAHYALGLAADRRGRPGEALARYAEAVRLDPRHAEARGNLAAHLADLGRDGEALLQYREALAVRPAFPEAHYGLAAVLSARGELEGAALHLAEALRLRPAWAEAHNNLGAVRARQGRLAEAAAHFREALRLRPGYEGARRNLERARADGAPAPP